jgi:hypothetical protein
MPWNECNPMDERLRFLARLLEGEKMAANRRPTLTSGQTSTPVHRRCASSVGSAAHAVAQRRCGWLSRPRMTSGRSVRR